MSSIKLSICIPTYNREKHLHDCLERCHRDFRFDFPYEIVISDNASTDNTGAVAKEFIERGMPIRYVRGAQNVGMIPNMNSALRLGRGEYMLYLADDDRLIPQEVANIVAYLDENPNITVCHAPWAMYDGINEVEGGLFYTVNEDKVFPQKSFAEVFNYMFRGHIFPEIGIYRSSAFRAAWVPRDICFYPFPMLAHFLDQGDIAFRKTPFYRQVIVSGVERDRVQGGAQIAATGWDQYRGGLEYFLYFASKRGKVGTSPDERATQEHLCRNFTLQRMAVSMRLLVGMREFVKAYEVYTRMVFGGFDEHPEVQSFKDGGLLATALQILVWQVSVTAGIENLVIHGFHDIDTIKERLFRVDFPLRLQMIDEPAAPTPRQLDNTAVLVHLPEERDRFVEMGYLPNLVFSQDDLIKTILL
ncbi:Glycosyl transferase, family 2 [Neorhizobium galegae bv. officinalis bv. officinalis str. HAMBI 1141]|uniref:Glycosyl transferase, family 2 n=1 Tax=Neorhizobium galegae bv. officinalis bv. officinalis str. HAMBI 1141 TaxID=1028801 RepID=A0A068T5J8_NEOGA|nr:MULTISPECIES: glycosyltransferase family 2 protein [Neorhizobium]MCJ9753017.1 glycosyltransferase family 2 protein [Neorhizobium sp. BETTINA12A]CDN52615.1 Glycosyl transferase, family 2 [Neorhizobium galegae bv. officinalis bv. officinalis str. HAMBI 1141]